MRGPTMPPGWDFEPADPGVGIWNHAFWHCGDEPAEEKLLGGTMRNDIDIIETTRVTCPECHESFTYEETCYVGTIDGDPMDW